MSIVGSNILAGASGSSGYKIERSLRFNSPDSAYLSRTPASAGNRKTWTWAGWVKLSNTAKEQALFSAAGYTILGFTAASKFRMEGSSGSIFCDLSSVSVFRDPSAWYHVVLSIDTTISSPSTNRVRIYVNNVLQELTGTYPPQNQDWTVNSTTSAHYIGSYLTGRLFDGYLADIHFIDGQALTPTSFGEFDANGIWQPKAYSGSYGTNGFQLKFADNSAATATTLGKDSSSNANNWTPNNLSVTAGAGNDSLIDVPVNGSEVDTGLGGQVRGNYCTWNALAVGSASDLAPSNGNLDATGFSASGYRNKSITGTIGVTSGKWYWEVAVTSVTSTLACMIGISSKSNPNELGDFPGANSFGWSYFAANGTKNNGPQLTYGASYTAGDVIGVALNVDNGTLTFYKNNTSQGTAYTGLTTGPYYPAIGHGGSVQAFVTSANFGQRPFAYTAPSGFKALCTANLPAPVVTKPSDVFDVKLYTGNGYTASGTQTISGLGFSPDFVWIKSRSFASNHALFDTIRGANKILVSNATDAERTDSTNNLISFNSDGFSLGADSDYAYVNRNGQTYAAWTWDAGSSTVTNTAGTISSQVRANASAGFSVVTGTAPAGNFTCGHGLGDIPSLIIVKERTAASAGWPVHHRSVCANTAQHLGLQNTNGVTSATEIFGAALPTGSVFGAKGGLTFATGATFVAYCFAPVAGYSAFGSYTGNGSADGPFVYTGFRPRWIMIKRTTTDTSGGNWVIKDALRPGYNETNLNLFANLSIAETTEYPIDVLSNGFKIRVSNTDVNGSSSQSYIYAAFAEAPFQISRAR